MADIKQSPSSIRVRRVAGEDHCGPGFRQQHFVFVHPFTVHVFFDSRPDCVFKPATVIGTDRHARLPLLPSRVGRKRPRPTLPGSLVLCPRKPGLYPRQCLGRTLKFLATNLFQHFPGTVPTVCRNFVSITGSIRQLIIA